MKQYLDLLKDVSCNGLSKGDRTGTGTISVFGRQFRHNLAEGFPLLTTKRLHFKSIANELIWFLNGKTNNTWLNDHGVSIWNEWANEEGDLGPIYGKQWTAWPLKDGSIFNQIDYVVNTIKNNPNSRRILFHAWNVEYLPDESLSSQENISKGKMALPPCHLIYQFYVAGNKLLSQMYIRSSDIFLGLPYNLASLALLTHMLSQQCQLEPSEIIISIGDLHIYNNHVQQIKTQLKREPRALPQLIINNKPKSIYDYNFKNFIIKGYNPYSRIAAAISI